ncbi:MAG: hypothetical protein NWE94_00640 [Candidatus Bathyarchaeota archaeon]|nr:hypothetical protein [Candidatus Bathyarchaeota archaeon]
MQRNSKTKSGNCVEMPLQQAVAVIGSTASAVPLDKRKEDADKPLYLKRV